LLDSPSCPQSYRFVGLYQWLLGRPFVYDTVRPLVVGGIDWSPFYARLGAGSDDVVLDIGCGTGEALRYLSSFREYVGFDTDPTAVAVARSKHKDRANARFVDSACTEQDIERLAPTRVALCGLLHHLRDDEAIAVLRALRRSPRLQRVATSDIVYLDGELLSNMLARLDRGRHCRDERGYHDLVASSGLVPVDSAVVRCHPTHGLAKYLMMTLAP
jgi:SAM-dependent methyltransferase